jgi:lipoprotein-anchoring transpeptidase ErfK/SrfK
MIKVNFSRVTVFLLLFSAYSVSLLPGADEVAALESPDRQTPIEELFQPPPPPKVMPRVLLKATPENTNLYLSLTRQQAWLFVEKEVAIETPISSGKRAAMTPRGDYTVLEKLEKTESPLFGDFVDRRGRVVRSGVSSKSDSAPAGTTFRPAAMQFFLRITPTGLGLHAGPLPGYPSAHGNVRFPEEIARLIFENVRVGTPVIIGD